MSVLMHAIEELKVFLLLLQCLRALLIKFPRQGFKKKKMRWMNTPKMEGLLNNCPATLWLLWFCFSMQIEPVFPLVGDLALPGDHSV